MVAKALRMQGLLRLFLGLQLDSWMGLQAIDTKDLNDKLAKDIEDALKMLAKKLPAILFYVA